jgi:hypothetical protein
MKKALVLVIYIATTIVAGPASAEVLSIYEIQYVDLNEHPDGNSLKEGQIIDCLGGVVIDKFRRGRVKLTIQDTNDPNALAGWGGIIVKNNKFTVDRAIFDDVNVGDWISFTNVLVNEDFGNTMLQFEPDSTFTIENNNNALPEPLVVTVDEIATPIEDSDAWLVADHNAEKYEAMLLQVKNVKVTDRDLGAHFDNYVLQDYDSIDPNQSCWATDYLNESQDEYGYHPFVQPGQHFCCVTGILEQFKGNRSGYDWDYYQLLTTYTTDLKRYTPADLNGDCMVDFADFAVFSQYWLWGVE